MTEESRKSVKCKVSRFLYPFDYSSVQLRPSMFKSQFNNTMRYYLDISNDDMLKGFRERAGLDSPGKDLGGWYTGNAGYLLRFRNTKKPSGFFNTFGQWLSAFARMYRVTGDAAVREKLGHLLSEYAKTTNKDGKFFYGIQPNALHYEFDKIVGGLVDSYKYAQEEGTIRYLERIVEWGAENLNQRKIPATPDHPTGGGIGFIGGKYSDSEWYTLSENLYHAYLLTGDPAYRDFAVVWHYESYWANLAAKKDCMAGLHAYSHVNTLSSAAMAYLASGDASYLKTIVNAYDFLQKRQVFATGGYGHGERMANDYGSLGNSLYLQQNSFETPCGSWAAFKLSRHLMMFTGKASYGDWIEKLLYNGIGAALPMAERGETYYYSDYRVSGGEKKYHTKTFPGDTWPCCSGTYPLAVTDYHNIIYFRDKESLYVNLFVPSQVKWNKSGSAITLVQDTNFPATGKLTFKIITCVPTEFCLKFRIPLWVQGNIPVKVNNYPVPGKWQPGEWGKIDRLWNNGDIVNIELPLHLYSLPVDEGHPGLVALMYGPVVLVADNPGTLPADIDPSSLILPTSDQLLVFKTKGQVNKREFRPYFTYRERERYYMYHNIQK